MKKAICYFLFTVFIVANFFSQSFIDKGYLNLEGPAIWNDAYVIYNLTTSNEKGGKARTTFVKDSYNKVLSLFEYDSKDWFILQNESNNIRNDKVGFFTYDYDNTFSLIWRLDDYLYNKDSTEIENAINIIEEKCDLIKKQLVDSYTSTKENFQKLSSEEKAILRKDIFKGTSGITVKFSRYVDSRKGYFTFTVFQKELNETSYFRVSDNTEVYYDNVDKEHLVTYSELDEKVLAICSELSLNKKIVFGVLKENSLKPYKDCGFILIKKE